jgi:hypothetical protein
MVETPEWVARELYFLSPEQQSKVVQSAIDAAANGGCSFYEVIMSVKSLAAPEIDLSVLGKELDG